METAAVNATLSVTAFGLVLAAGLVARHRGVMSTPMTVLWVSYLALAVVGVVSSLVAPLGLPVDDARIVIAFFRAVTIILLLGYVVSRWRDRSPA